MRAALHPTGLYLAVRPIDPSELRDPFMQETIARVPAQDGLVHVARDRLGHEPASSAPAGVIFHVARCGSTLISQSLKQLDVVVYSEPQPVNELLAPPHRWPRADIVAALRSLGAAFARHARRRYVLKLSSWNTLYCDIVAEAFPETPWILSIRDPLEVGVSLLTTPPGWFQPATDAARGLVVKVDPGQASRSREEFIARAYGAFCTAAATLNPRRGHLVHYESLPSAVWSVVAPQFSLEVDASQRDRIAAASKRHAKAAIGAVAEFKSDSSEKRASASPELRLAIDSLARPQLERLLRLHAATVTG